MNALRPEDLPSRVDREVTESERAYEELRIAVEELKTALANAFRSLIEETWAFLHLLAGVFDDY